MNNEHPLGLPPGSVRGLITLILTLMVAGLGTAWALGAPLAGDSLKAVGPFATYAIGQYFGARPDKRAS